MRTRWWRPRPPGFFNSITPSGRPLTKSTTSGRRLFLFSVTVNWFTARQWLLAGLSKSMTCACAPRMAPLCARYSTVTPSTSIRWKDRLRASRVAPSGRVSLRNASSNASAGRPGVEKCEGVAQPSRQDHLPVVGPLSAWRIRRDVGTVGDAPAEAGQPGEGGLFNVGFGDGSHSGVPPPCSRLRARQLICLVSFNADMSSWTVLVKSS